MDEFIDRVYDSRVDRPNIKVETLDAIALLHTLHKKSRNPLGGDYFMTPDSFFPLGMKIYRDIEELLIEGVPARKVKEIDGVLTESLPQLSAGRLQTLSYFFEEFYSWMASRGMSTRSSRYRAASETLSIEDLGPFRKTIFAGFYALTRSEKVLFRKILSWENSLFLFQEGPGMEEVLADLGIEAAAPPAEAIEPEVRFYRSPDTHGQVFALGGLLKKELEGGIPLNENSVIVLPLADTLFPHGIEFNPDMVELSIRNAAAAGVSDKATFANADLFESDFSRATVITMFLLPDINLRLRPKLLNLKPGTRIVSNSFTMEDWQADGSVSAEGGCQTWCTAYLWIIPAKVEGKWRLPNGELTIHQKFQNITGTLSRNGNDTPITGRLDGERISFSSGDAEYSGQINGDSISGTVKLAAGEIKWKAVREKSQSSVISH